MAADETPEDRLEAALERIAKIVEARDVTAAMAAPAASAAATPSPVASEVAARLDRIIETLRQALGDASGK